MNSAGSTVLPEQLHAFIKALGSETRQRALLLLADGQPRTVNEVAEALNMGQSTVSEQLALMRQAGLLKSRRVGKEVLHEPDRETILATLKALERWVKACC